MSTTSHKKGDGRIEFRVSKEDKAFFEHASRLRGFKSFSEFVRLAVYKEAKAIVDEEQRILVSRRDKEIFFNALMGEETKPNDALLAAIKLHDQKVTD